MPVQHLSAPRKMGKLVPVRDLNKRKYPDKLCKPRTIPLGKLLYNFY